MRLDDGKGGLTVTQAVMRTVMQPVIGTRVWAGIRRPDGKNLSGTPFTYRNRSYTATRQWPVRKTDLREAHINTDPGNLNQLEISHRNWSHLLGISTCSPRSELLAKAGEQGYVSVCQVNMTGGA